MPFTPYHFGPHACVALPLRRYIDLPVFILANVAVDIEPLVVMLFRLPYPLHGFLHTFLIGAFVGIICASSAYLLRNVFKKVMKSVRLHYNTSFVKMLISAVLGVWLHVVFDAVLYWDVKPFYPAGIKPFFGLFAYDTVQRICLISFIPALALYILAVIMDRKLIK